MELVVGSGELNKTQFREALLEQEHGGLRYIGQIRLGGSLTNPCIPTDCLVDQFPLEGRRRGFSLSSSISSSITHRRVICVCISLPYSFLFHFTAVLLQIWIKVALLLVCLCLHYSALSIKLVYNQPSCNFKIRGLYKLLCFQHIFELSVSINSINVLYPNF